MKNYRHLVESLPPKTVVFAFGRFNPPTTGHELLIKAVKKLASMNKADHVIYASKTQNAKKDPLSVNKKVHYLNIMFPGTHFVAANEEIRTFIEAVKKLNSKYKNIIMVAGSDRVSEYKSILEKYNGKEFNYNSIQVVSAGERDPDSDSASGMSATKMRTAASKGDYANFKKGLPSHIREIDAKLLMNDVREGLGLDPIKEQVKFTVDEIREKYFQGQIFNEGDFVESNGIEYTIVKRGSNHILVEDLDGNKVSKWIKDVSPIQKPEVEMNEELTKKTIKSNDKIKVARMIADFLGYEDAERGSNPSTLVNTALRKVKSKIVHTDSINMLVRMLKLADDVGIDYDKNALPAKLKEACESKHEPRVVAIDKKSNRNAAGDIMSYKDFKKSIALNKGVKESLDVNSEIDVDNLDDQEDLHVFDTDGKEFTIKKWDQRRVGHSFGNTDNDTLRRMKVRYKTEEVDYDLEEDFTPKTKDYKVTLQHTHPDGKKEDYVYHVKNVKSDKHAAWTAMKKHEEKKIPYKMITATKKELVEDVYSADYKVNPDTGRKSKAHRIDFANSGTKDKLEPEKVKEEAELFEVQMKMNYKDWLKQNNKNHSPENVELYKKTQKEEADIEFTKAEKKTKKPDAKVDNDSNGIGGTSGKGFDAFFREENEEDFDFSEDELEKMANEIESEDDILDAYDDEELAIVDDETGEEIEEDKPVNEEALNEVLSRAERIKSRIRFARTKAKRERKVKIALKKHSDVKTLNRRARKLAVKAMKQRIVKKPLKDLTVGEKERIERMLQSRKKLIDRLAMRMVPKVRKIEQERLSHAKYTKKN
jgi:phosphopantetheine adenylyltransferase